VRYSERERHLAGIAGLLALGVAVLLFLYLLPGSNGPPQLAQNTPHPVSRPQTPASPAGTRSSGPPTKRSVTADYAVRGKWRNGFNAELTITNLGTDPIEGWTVQLQMPPGVSVLNSWAAEASQKATSLTLRSQPWNTYVAPGAAIRMGFQASGSAAAPRSCTINGSPC
jgi:cellulase/cellobiase CelA1